MGQSRQGRSQDRLRFRLRREADRDDAPGPGGLPSRQEDQVRFLEQCIKSRILS